MSYFAKQRILYYKKFKIDIWGIFKNTLQWKKDRSNYFCSYLRSSRSYFSNLTKIKAKDYYYQQKNNAFNQRPYLYHKYGRKVHKWWFNRIRVLSILYKNIMFKVFKIKISKKVSKVFSFFFDKKKRFDKIYYKKPFLYEIRLYYKQKKKYFAQSQFANLRLTRLFYIIYTYKQLKFLCKKSKKMDGLFEQNYILLMECKLPSFIYRTSFLSNMFYCLSFIKNNNVWINKKFMSYIYYTVTSMDLIGFRIISKSYIYWNFFKRLRRKAFIFLLPKYIYFSLSFFLLILLRIPYKKELINPISIDMYRLSNYII